VQCVVIVEFDLTDPLIKLTGVHACGSVTSLPLCTFVSFVVDEVQMLEPQRTRRYTKDVMETLDVLVRGPIEIHA
jgi:hypothetical protein